MRLSKYMSRDTLCGIIHEITHMAVLTGSTSREITDQLITRVYSTDSYKRLPRYDHGYIHAVADMTRKLYIEPLLDYGDWVKMPDGSEKYFGTADKLHVPTAELERETGVSGIHRYIYENKVRGGIYWKPVSGKWGPGEKIHFASVESNIINRVIG